MSTKRAREALIAALMFIDVRQVEQIEGFVQILMETDLAAEEVCYVERRLGEVRSAMVCQGAVNPGGAHEDS